MSVGPQRTYSDETKVRVIALYRAYGRNAYRASKVSGVPRTTLYRWISKLGEDYGALPAAADRVERVSDSLDAGKLDLDPTSVPGALEKLDRVRHLYLDQLARPEVVARASARDASSVVQGVTAQIQLLTGQPTGRSETRVRYVERGALREMARRMRLERATTLAIESGTESES